jgi:SAM-dependent methyltransferase
MNIESKQLVTSLLENLQASKETVMAVVNKEERALSLKVIFKETSVDCNPQLVANLATFYNFCVDNMGYEADDLIREIQSGMDTEFDKKLREREARDGFDAKYGTETETVIEKFEVPEAISEKRWLHSARYVGSPIRSVKLALNIIGELGVVCQEYSFVDVGCGLGRNLLLATDYPFQSIVGIEISAYMAKIAESNITKYIAVTGVTRRPEVRCGDALTADLPAGNLVLYFWEPFSPEVGAQFIELLVTLLERSGSKCLLIFLGTVFPVVLNNTAFVLIHEGHTEDIKDHMENFKLSVFDYFGLSLKK